MKGDNTRVTTTFRVTTRGREMDDMSESEEQKGT